MSFSLVGSVIDLIVTVLSVLGLGGLFALMVVESFGIPPLPSEVILPFAGFLVASGTFPLLPTIVLAIGGALVGSLVAYAVGRWWRHRITGIGVGSLRLEPRHLERMDRYFAEKGEVTVAVARVIPVVRAYISYPAGTARMPLPKFVAFTLLGSTPFVLALVYAGMLLRADWTAVTSDFQYLDYAVFALLAIVVVYVILQVAGVLAPGWPPRRLRRTDAASAPAKSG